MNASSIEARGFTLVELLAVLVLLGVLAAVALPRLQGLSEFRVDAWRDQLAAGLRLASATATAHRRLVCAQVDASGVLSLSLARSHGALACDSAIAGPAGGNAFSEAAGVAVSLSPAGPFYFQPSGRVSSDAAGLTVVDRRIQAAGVADLLVYGESGHVE